jgi:hypothetical protein
MNGSRVAPIVFLLILASASVAPAQSTVACPWLTSGSAAKALGGDVTMTAHASENGEGSCEFVRQVGPVMEKIDIEVGKSDTHPCPDGSTALSALGNQAVQCRRNPSPGQRADIIAGRVRDVYFVVTMVNVPGAAEEASADARPVDSYGASLLERIAEQVVGNLY